MQENLDFKGLGRRKSSVARVRMIAGSGKLLLIVITHLNNTSLILSLSKIWRCYLEDFNLLSSTCCEAEAARSVVFDRLGLPLYYGILQFSPLIWPPYTYTHAYVV